MTENNKPEWFEIAENDGPAALPKSSKALPMLAVFGAALIIGVGAVVAQVQEKSPVDPAASNPAQTASVSNSSSPATVTPSAVTSSGANASTTPALKNPSIAQLPTNGDDDEDEYEDDEDEDEDDEYEDDDEDEEDDD